MKKDVYCDLESLKLLSIGREKYWQSQDDDSPDRVYSDFASIIMKSDLHIDCEEIDFCKEATNNEWLRKIYQSYYSNTSIYNNNITFEEGSIQALLYDPPLQHEINYNSLVLSKPSHDTNASKRGVLNIRVNDNGISFDAIKRNDITLAQYEESDWEKVFQKLDAPINCNSMIIADNYIFNDVDNNLYKILDLLLPQTSDITFHLTIFSAFYDEKDLNTGNIITANDQINAKKTELEERIKGSSNKNSNSHSPLRPFLNINIELFNDVVDHTGIKKNKFFHKRLILTNQYVIISEKFNLFYKRFDNKTKRTISYAANESKISISYPLINDVDEESYWINLKAARDCLFKIQLNSNNRLLRFFKGSYLNTGRGKTRLEKYPDLMITSRRGIFNNNDTVTFELDVNPSPYNPKVPFYSAKNVSLPDTIKHKPFSSYTP